MSFLGSMASTNAKTGFLGMGIQGISQLMGGKQQQGVYNQQASILDEQAESSRIKSSLDEYKARKTAKGVIGAQQAAYAGAGVSVGTGSPIDVMVDSLSNAFLEIEINKYTAAVEASRYKSESEMLKYQGKKARQESTFNAGMTILQGASLYGEKTKKTGVV